MLRTDPDAPSPARLRRARAVRRVFITLLAAFVALGAFGLWGSRTGEVSASADGYTLSVRYPEATRGGLAVAFDIGVTRAGGFDGPVVLAVDADWLAMFDENGLDPDPSTATADGRAGVVVWEFHPPESDRLTVSFDARVEPAVSWGKSGSVALLDTDGSTITSVDFDTRVMP